MVDPPPTMPIPIEQTLLDQVRAELGHRGWLAVHLRQAATIYTIGLSTYDLPELVVCDVTDAITPQIDRWAARLVAGDLTVAPLIAVTDAELRPHVLATREYDIASRGGLHLARALYGPRLRAWEIDIRSCRCSPCRNGLFRTLPVREKP